ncbi:MULTISPECIES: helix-turn-helix domain-containing protein [Streptomyces]|uniref:Helix-turn-helix domain-containing protein n=1 Tax=Streptomyces ehimensis TaxID=68195 RepID=A0ABV9BQX9_9ACTN
MVDDDKLAVARARHAKGESVTAIAEAMGTSRTTLYRHIGAGHSSGSCHT